MSSASSTPQLYTSALLVYSSCRIISGAIYTYVPVSPVKHVALQPPIATTHHYHTSHVHFVIVSCTGNNLFASAGGKELCRDILHVSGTRKHPAGATCVAYGANLGLCNRQMNERMNERCVSSRLG